jgi:hypothetical protein
MEFLQMNKCNTMDLSYIYFYWKTQKKKAVA